MPSGISPQDTEQPKNKPRRPSSRDKLHIPAEKASSQKGTWSMGLSVGNSGGASTEVGGHSFLYVPCEYGFGFKRFDEHTQ